MNYLYDSTYEGFLTCVYHHWYTEKAEGIFPESAYQLDLCRYAMTVVSDADRAGRVQDAIVEKISKWDAQRIYQAFCSGEQGKEMDLLRYIVFGFQRGPKIRLLHGDPVVKAVEATARRVGLEVHRMCGLIRFSEVRDAAGGDAILYAKFEPDNDILEFLAPHFSDRFKNEPFIIHDLGREKALFAYQKKWEIAALKAGVMGSPDAKNEASGFEYLKDDVTGAGDCSTGMHAGGEGADNGDAAGACVGSKGASSRGMDGRKVCDKGADGTHAGGGDTDSKRADSGNKDNKRAGAGDIGPPPLQFTANEQDIRELWKRYFEIMAIRERTNPKCQRNLMPSRYWKHLTESAP